MSLTQLQTRIIRCRRCPRLIRHCQEMATIKRRAYRDQDYWGRPVPSFGDPAARLLVVGLAPGAHGANRTGRVFTGDRSGEFLYRALHETGFANQPTARHRDDGLTLTGCWITNLVHCAPPDNRPTPDEIRTCRRWLDGELALLPNLQVIVTLGRIAWDSYLALTSTRAPFAHGALHQPATGPAVLASYHPSQQNTQTGRLTYPMLLSVFEWARRTVDNDLQAREALSQ